MKNTSEESKQLQQEQNYIIFQSVSDKTLYKLPLTKSNDTLDRLYPI